ncbi:MFS transporter [Longirhabdus pacifica]|uniref:MFS transporter n=1 Tax=Longirhabdus pacifica TaxID=2305227 RepID=UPI0010088ED9|nr:MFS transporter [Longirhabdus pacifica]
MQQLMKNRVFIILMASDVLQNIGIWIRNMALLYFVLEKTNADPVANSLLLVMEYAPIFIFSIIGGALADRWRPKRTMIWGDILSFLSILVIIFILEMNIWQAVFAATFISAIVSQFSQPSSLKLIKDHVPEEHTQAAVAISQMNMSLFFILGPIVGTLFYQTFGLMFSLQILLVIFALSAITLTFLPKSKPIQHKVSQPIWGDLKDGFKYIQQHRHLKTLMLMYSILAIGAGLTTPLEVFIIIDRLSLPKENLQWFAAIGGFGMLVGGIYAAIKPVRKEKFHRFIFASFFILCIGTIIEVLSIWPLLTGSMRWLTSFFLAVASTIIATLFITSIDQSYVGRVNGIITPLYSGFLLLGTSLAGIYMKSTSLIVVFITAAIFFLIASVVSLRLSFPEKSNKSMRSEA